MPFQLSWSIEGEQQLLRNLRGIRESMRDWKPAYTQAAKELKSIFESDVFETKGRAINTTWKPLSPKYLAQKRREGYPPDPLIRTGEMQKSFKGRVSTDYAEISNTANYFKYHQSKAARKKIPRRIMMKLGNDQKELVVKIFHTHFVKKIKK